LTTPAITVLIQLYRCFFQHARVKLILR